MMLDFHTPGLAVGVIHKNQTWQMGLGVTDIDTQEPVTPHTLFYTGSTTKSFAAALASKLIYNFDKDGVRSEKDIKWSTPLRNLIGADFLLHDNEYATAHTTIADALSHRTGLPRHDFSWVNGDATLKGMVQRLRYLPLHNEIRAKYEYCNLMFTAVAYALETVTGNAFGDLLSDWIFAPLGMSESVYSIHDAQALADQQGNNVSLARGHTYDLITGKYVRTEWDSIPPGIGAGGIISSVNDYIKWIRLFLYPNEHNKTIATAAVEEMTSPYIPIGKKQAPFKGIMAYGLSLELTTYRNHDVVTHDGALGGYMTGMMWLPELEWGIVVMHNSYNFTHDALMWHLLDEFLETPSAQRIDIQGWTRDLLQRLENNTISARERLYPDTPTESDQIAPPALELRAYEGLYHNPGYHNWTVRVPSKASDDSDSKMTLHLDPAAHSYLDLSGVLHHVDAESWLYRVGMGPQQPFDDVGRARFVVGGNGKVSGMRFQAEPAIDSAEGMAWFEKVE